MTALTLGQDIYRQALEQGARYYPATYKLDPNGDTSSQTYAFRPQSGRGPFVVLGVQLPGADAFVDVRSGGIVYTDGQVYAPHVFDNRVADLNPGKLTAPIVVDEASQLRIKAEAIDGATNPLDTTGLLVWGFHTDRHFSQYLRETGEFNAVSLDTGTLSAATQFTRQQFTLDWDTWYHYVYEELNVGGEDGALSPSDLRLDAGELQMHPDGTGLFPTLPQKAGAWLGIQLGVGAQILLTGGMTGTPGEGRVTVTFAGRRTYTKKRGSARGGF